MHHQIFILLSWVYTSKFVLTSFFLTSPCWKASMSTFEQRDLSRRILSHFVVNMSKKTCLCKLVLYYTLYQTFVYRILFKAEEWEIVSQVLLRRVVESDRIRLLLFHSKYRGHSSLNKVPKWPCIKVVKYYASLHCLMVNMFRFTKVLTTDLRKIYERFPPRRRLPRSKFLCIRLHWLTDCLRHLF